MFYKIKISFKKVGEFLNGVVFLFEDFGVIDFDTVGECVFGRGQVVTFGHLDIAANGNGTRICNHLLSLLRYEIIKDRRP